MYSRHEIYLKYFVEQYFKSPKLILHVKNSIAADICLTEDPFENVVNRIARVALVIN